MAEHELFHTSQDPQQASVEQIQRRLNQPPGPSPLGDTLKAYDPNEILLGESQRFIRPKISPRLSTAEDPKYHQTFMDNWRRNPQNHTTWIGGPPGSGKTERFKELFQILTNEGAIVHRVRYDPCVDFAQRVIAPREFNKKPNWLREYWDLVADLLETRVELTPVWQRMLAGEKQPNIINGQRHHVLVEAVFTGFNPRENKAETSMDHFVNTRYGNTPPLNELDVNNAWGTVELITPHEEIRSLAGDIRDAMDNKDENGNFLVPDEEVEPKLEGFNRKVFFLEEYMSQDPQYNGLDFQNPAIRGHAIRSQLRKSAPRSRIQKYNDDYEAYAYKLIESGLMPPIDQLPGLPEQVLRNVGTNNAVRFLLNHSVHEAHIRNVWKLRPGVGNAVANFYLGKRVPMAIDARIWKDEQLKTS
jgi:hypothetical protein